MTYPTPAWWGGGNVKVHVGSGKNYLCIKMHYAS